ncbi:nickel transporter [Variovorax sp. J22P168]|uniref:HoxN/HupN/NixA family nickel/cobalt transporter n=1 Tax=Variovorax jilinensis TaxID=3053513 RepID=UPI0025791672|nr:nickel transporter [Variovorax sp. J22P168]MDM0015547.1 nickel transporter [Variovorax sp. J22P168]
MDALPATWSALCVLAFVLGLKHGFDADHLATIDGLTRYNARANPRLAKVAGTLFSLGHGVVILIVAWVAGTVSSGWQTPGWLEVTGVAVSTLFLFGLAFVNVHAVLTTAPNTVVAPSGLKGRLLGRVLTVRRPWAIAAVGMLFALSFDTVSLAALFALSASRFGGVFQALFVAALFVFGMFVVDGINGVWISALIRRADRAAVVASRIMALGVAALSLAVGIFTVTKLLLPAVDAWAEGHSLVFGAVVVGGVMLAFAGSMWAARHPRHVVVAAASASD